MGAGRVASEEETYRPVIEMRNTLAMIAAALLAAVAAVGLFLSRGITNAISQLTATMLRLAEGDTSVDLSGQDRADEIGEMTKAVSIFRDNAIERERLEELQRSEKLRAEAATKERMAEFVSKFNGTVAQIIGKVTQAAGDMEVNARAVSQVAQNASERSNTVAAASEETSTNVQTVAAAAEELSSSIHEITKQVAQSTTIVGRAKENTQASSDKVKTLAAAPRRSAASSA